jgi:hypothetical protein
MTKFITYWNDPVSVSKRDDQVVTFDIRKKALTTRSRAQKDAIAPPIECPATIMGISPFNFLVCSTALKTSDLKVVLWYAE